MDKYLVQIDARKVIYNGKYSNEIIHFKEIFTDYNCAVNFTKEEIYYERDGVHYLIECMSDPIRIKDIQNNKDTKKSHLLNGMIGSM